MASLNEMIKQYRRNGKFGSLYARVFKSPQEVPMDDHNTSMQELKELLKKHDDTFDFSDDHRVWKKGLQEREEIGVRLLRLPIDKALYVLRDYKGWGGNNPNEYFEYFTHTSVGQVQMFINKTNKEDAMTSTETLNKAIDSLGMKVKPIGVAKNAGEFTRYTIPRMDKQDKTKQIGKFEVVFIWGMGVQYVFPKNRSFQQWVTVPFTQAQQDGFYGTACISYQRMVEKNVFEEEWNDVVKIGKETLTYKGETFAIVEPNDYFGWRVAKLSKILGMDDANKRYVYDKFRTMARAIQAGIKQTDKCPLSSLSVVYGPKTEMKQVLSGPHGIYLAPIKGTIEDIKASLYTPKEEDKKGAEKAAEAFDKVLENLAE